MYIEELIDSAHLESKTIEYKGIIEEGISTSGKNLEIGWLKTLVAFGNTEGGTMYIGVEDKTHKVVSLDQKTADKVILLIHRQIRERVDPVLDYDISSIVIKDGQSPRYVLKIDVKSNRNLPVSLHENGLLGIYVRNYGRTDLATSEQIRDMVLMSDHTPFDAPFTEYAYDSGNFTKFFALLKERNITCSDKELISHGIISQDGFLSRGARLFEDSCRDLRTKIVMTKWPGLTKGGDIIQATNEYVGNLIDGIDQSIQFIKNHSTNGFIKEADSRTPYYSFPARSILEGIVNAIGHRNYYIQGSQIEINIFPNRLEITSPGALLGVREIRQEKNISSIIPRRRNDVICDMLEICRYMEERGSGFDKIESDYAPYGELYKPFISADMSSFTLTLPDLTYSNGVPDTNNDCPDVYANIATTGRNDLKILSFCFLKPKSVREIADYLSVTPSTYFRSNTIDRLVRSKLLVMHQAENMKLYSSNTNHVFLK